MFQVYMRKCHLTPTLLRVIKSEHRLVPNQTEKCNYNIGDIFFGVTHFLCHFFYNSWNLNIISSEEFYMLNFFC